LKIFIIHCKYQKKGGEDVIFSTEVNLLKQDQEVAFYEIQNSTGFWGLLQYVFMVCNVYQANKILKKIELFKPDVVHIHNLHFAIGPWVIRTIKRKLNLPIVKTINNFRFLCPSATFLIKNKLDISSLNQTFPTQAIWKKAYKNSFLLTFWLAFNNWFHGMIKTWDMVDKYIVNNAFSKSLFSKNKTGFPTNNIVIKQNGIEDFGVSTLNRSNRFLFIGRLSEEKGIIELLDLAKKIGFLLDIIGEGPLTPKVKESVVGVSNIVLHGQRDKDFIIEYLRKCNALIFPSKWFEGMPITILEAFSTGTPVIASNIGAMANMIIDGENGLLVSLNNTNEWITKINYWINLPRSQKVNFYDAARKSYLENYTLEANKMNLLDIYNSVLGINK
jgi:glycosyltransferase involved in cell wall biosynthesis